MSELHDPALPAPASPPEPVPSLRERSLDLVALLVLLVLAAIVFTLAGPSAFTAVNSVGVGLFATWRTRPPRR
jgi:hypothetical protein